MGAGCRTLGNAPVRAGTPIGQHAPMALSDPPMGMGVCCWFVNSCGNAKGTDIPMASQCLLRIRARLEVGAFSG
eukprot:4964128-Pyramimonas_sp.AAC.1